MDMVSKETRKYLAAIGSKGGKKSKRAISPKQQKKMQEGRKLGQTNALSKGK